jgi:hypothetical protein
MTAHLDPCGASALLCIDNRGPPRCRPRLGCAVFRDCCRLGGSGLGRNHRRRLRPSCPGGSSCTCRRAFLANSPLLFHRSGWLRCGCCWLGLGTSLLGRCHRLRLHLQLLRRCVSRCRRCRRRRHCRCRLPRYCSLPFFLLPFFLLPFFLLPFFLLPFFLLPFLLLPFLLLPFLVCTSLLYDGRHLLPLVLGSLKFYPRWSRANIVSLVSKSSSLHETRHCSQPRRTGTEALVFLSPRDLISAH